MKIDFTQPGTPLVHTWSNCVGAGRANEGLRADWQQQLKTVVDDCGFRYLRFHGLLHDDMQVYTEQDGQPVYNFQYIDKLFDAMLARNIRPFVEFGFMPPALASTPRTQFWWKGRVAPPTSLEKWAELVRRTVEHWIRRYGLEEVRQWYFEIWNEPDLRAFWDGTRSQYFALYKASVTAIKSVCPDLRVGGPATSNYVPDERFAGEVEDTSCHATFRQEDINTLPWRGVWIREFLDFCAAEKLPVDFVSTHPYPTDFALDGYGQSRGRTRCRDSLLQDVQWLRDVVAHSAYPDAELHLTEWSSSPSSRDYSHDYLPAAAYILRCNLQCAGLVNSLSYWVFTDVFEEVGAGPLPFHGGFGMINLQGVKKPAFHAYRMLNALGDVELERGEGWIFTRRGDGLAAVFYHYPDQFTDAVPMSNYPDQGPAQACQAIQAVRELHFTVTGLRPGSRYRLETLRSGQTAVELWNRMGAPAETTRGQEEELRRQGEALDCSAFRADETGTLQLNLVLDAWTIALLREASE